MKRYYILVLLGVFLINFSSAACDLSVSMINQDPYPAVPGDYVKVVFQVTGIENPQCKEVSFELLGQYPIIFDPNSKQVYEVEAGTFSKDFSSFLIAPYKVRIDENALDGANPLEVKYRSNYKGNTAKAYLTKQFNLEVQDARADFEVHIKDYNYQTHELTLEILNIAGVDVEALTIEIPKQDSIIVKGANKIIVGDLDSNEYTTADVEAIPSSGEFKINLIYSDTIDARRTIEKTLSFNPSYFKDRKADETNISTTTYIIYGIIISLFLYWGIKKYLKKKKK